MKYRRTRKSKVDEKRGRGKMGPPTQQFNQGVITTNKYSPTVCTFRENKDFIK